MDSDDTIIGTASTNRKYHESRNFSISTKISIVFVTESMILFQVS